MSFFFSLIFLKREKFCCNMVIAQSLKILKYGRTTSLIENTVSGNKSIFDFSLFYPLPLCFFPRYFFFQTFMSFLLLVFITLCDPSFSLSSYHLWFIILVLLYHLFYKKISTNICSRFLFFTLIHCKLSCLSLFN